MVRSAILKRRWLRTARPTSTALASFRPVPSLACKYVHVSEILRPRLVHFFCFARAYNRNLRNCGPRTKPSLPPSTPRGGCLFVLLICVSPIDSTGHAHLGVHPVDRSHRHDGARTPSQRHGWRARPSRVRRVVSLLTFHQRRLPFVLLYLSLCSADLLGNPLGGSSLPLPDLDCSRRISRPLTPLIPQVWSSPPLFLAVTIRLCSKSLNGTTLSVPVSAFSSTAFRTHYRFRCPRRPSCHSDKLAYAPRCICRRVLLEELLRFISGTCLP